MKCVALGMEYQNKCTRLRTGELENWWSRDGRMCRPRGHLAINFDPSTNRPEVIKRKREKERKKSSLNTEKENEKQTAFLSIGLRELEMAKKTCGCSKKQFPAGLQMFPRGR